MSRIKSKDTKPEIVLRKKLFSHGFRYRINFKKLPGKPDIYLTKYKTSIFVHGCFWHGHEDCKDAHLPKSNINFWKKKIDDNIKRDKKILEVHKKIGLNTIIVWECQLMPKNIDNTLNDIISRISNNIIT